MSNDSEISVKLTASPESLEQGLAAALTSVRDAVDSMHVAFSLGFHKLSETVKEGLGEAEKVTKEKADSIRETLEKMLHLEQIQVGIEVFKEGLEALKEVFESTVGAAEEFGLANAKFAAIMHVSEDDAAGLSAALRGVGVDTGTYESIAVRLQQRLEQGTGINKDLANSFKDQNAHVLEGQALMDRLGEVLGQYNEQGQTAVVVQLGLGRRIQDVTSALRVHQEAIEHQKELYTALGVNISGTSQTAQKFEESINDVRTIFQAFALSLGQQFLPIFSDMIDSMKGPGIQALNGIAAAVKFVYFTFDVLASGVASAVRSIVLVLQELWDTLKAGGKLLVDIMKGDFNAFIVDFNKGLTEGVKDAKAAGQDIARYWKENDEVFDSLFGEKKQKSAEKNVFQLPTGSKGAPARPGPRDNSADQAIRDEAKLAVARIAMEEQTNQHLLAMGKETADQFVSIQRDLEDRKFLIQTAALHQEMALPGKTKAERAKILDEILQLDVEHQAALLKIDQEGESRRVQAARAAVQEFIKTDDERLKAAIQVNDEEFKQGLLSAGQKYAIEKQLTVDIRNEQIKRLQDEQATLVKGTEQYEALQRQIDRLQSEKKTGVQGLDKNLWKDTFDQVTHYSKGFFDSFNQGINGMLLEGKSFGDTMKDISKSMASALIQDIEQTGEKFIEQQITNALVAKTTTESSAVSQISANAGVAASGAAASQAGIPFIGPLLAAAAATAMIGLVTGFESLAHASGGMQLDRDQLVFAHKGEQILPASISRGLTDMIQGGGGGGDENHYHFPTTINGGGGPDVLQALQKQPRVLAAMIKQLQRDGTLR